MKKKKNKAAQDLVAIRWAKASKAKRSAHGKMMVTAREAKRALTRLRKMEYIESVDSTTKVAEDAGEYSAR